MAAGRMKNSHVQSAADKKRRVLCSLIVLVDNHEGLYKELRNSLVCGWGYNRSLVNLVQAVSSYALPPFRKRSCSRMLLR